MQISMKGWWYDIKLFRGFNSVTCLCDWPLVLLALVRVRRPGTVDVPLSPPCRLLFSTAFMFSCSAASSAYWIPWGWLSCASDGAPPNLPLWRRGEDTWLQYDVLLAAHGETQCSATFSILEPQGKALNVKLVKQVNLHSSLQLKIETICHFRVKSSTYAFKVCDTNKKRNPWWFLATMQTCWFSLETLWPPSPLILSTLQLTSCKHLFSSLRHHLETSSFMRFHTQIQLLTTRLR